MKLETVTHQVPDEWALVLNWVSEAIGEHDASWEKGEQEPCACAELVRKELDEGAYSYLPMNRPRARAKNRSRLIRRREAGLNGLMGPSRLATKPLSARFGR